MYQCKIAERLSELRQAKDVTQEEMARHLNISNKTISKWENGTSTPDLEMLIKISEYFGVTTDALLGIAQHEDRSTEQMLRFELRGLDRNEMAFKVFDIVKSIIPAECERLAIYKDYGGCRVFPTEDIYGRYCISTPDFFEYASSSDNSNIAVIQLPNKSNFKWMNDKRYQEKIVEIFSLLSSCEALSVCHFLHSADCSESFTSDHVAKGADVPEEKAISVLNTLCKIGFCQVMDANLDEGLVRVYNMTGDGILLSIISLAYERVCNREGFQYNLRGSGKMIGGKK